LESGFFLFIPVPFFQKEGKEMRKKLKKRNRSRNKKRIFKRMGGGS